MGCFSRQYFHEDGEHRCRCIHVSIQRRTGDIHDWAGCEHLPVHGTLSVHLLGDALQHLGAISHSSVLSSRSLCSRLCILCGRIGVEQLGSGGLQKDCLVLTIGNEGTGSVW